MSLRENRRFLDEGRMTTNQESRRIGKDAQDCILGYSQPSLRDWSVASNPTQDLRPGLLSAVPAGLHTGDKCWVPHCPDSLRRRVALIHFMRLSLMKGAHADLSSTAWQEIGVKPYFGLSGIMALDVPLSVCHARPKDKTPQKGTGSQFTRRF
jgi:hypothetical protein